MSDLSFLEGHDPAALAELAAAGVGEGDFTDHGDVPPELTALFIELERQGRTPAELRAWAEAIE